MPDNTNRVSATLSDADRDAVLAAINTIKSKLPFLVDLSPDDRRTLAKMGDKSRAFVDKAFQAAQQNPTALPGAFDIGEFEKDNALFQQLMQIAPAMTQLTEKFDDTTMALGADLFAEALTVYGFLKAAGKGAGLDDLRASLGQRFARASKPAPPAGGGAPK